MLLEGSGSSGDGLSIIGAIRHGVGEEVSGETGLFRELVTKILVLLVGSGLELLEGLSEYCLHLVCVGLVDLLGSLKASQKIIGGDGSSGIDADAPVGGMPAGSLVEGRAAALAAAGAAAGGGPGGSAEPAGPALAGPGDDSATGSAWALMPGSEDDAAALVEVLVFLLGPMNLISASNAGKSDSVSLRLQGSHISCADGLDRKFVAGRTENFAQDVQACEQERAKNLSPNLQK